MSLITTIDEFKLQYDDDMFIIRNKKLSPDVLEYYVNNYVVDWDYISEFQTLSESFIEQYSDKVNWTIISRYQTLTESFIDRYNDKVDWYHIVIFQTLTEAVIEKYSDVISLDWTSITINQTLSETFIEKYSYKLGWSYISAYQTLSESFIEKYIDKVFWYGISLYQTLTESFITRYSDKVDWYNLFMNKKTILRYEFIVEHLYKFSLYEASTNNKSNVTININRLVKEHQEKYQIDKLAHEFNKKY